MRQVFLVLFILCGINSYSQKQYIILDSVTKQPIEFANIVMLQFMKGTSSGKDGKAIFRDTGIAGKDSIAITHVSYHTLYFQFDEFKNLDTILLQPKYRDITEVVVISSKQYTHKKNLGFFQNKLEGLMSLRSGSQIALKIENPQNIQAVLSKVKLHFDKLVPDVRFRLRLIEINNDGSFGNDLIPNGLIFKPTTLKSSISLTEYNVFLPVNGVLICVDNLGDGKVYSSRLDEPVTSIRMTQRLSKPLTYVNYRDTKWGIWNVAFSGYKISNAQIQLTILTRK